ncbi:MAG: sigma-54-dependent Fis family transcriptional regulator [Clostridiales bacterium]|nr:sigma-54-dependent Fis family transcriptional regulator [Clostridiales bacterium]
MFNLLVVDDEKAICNSLKFAFEDEFIVHTASNSTDLNKITNLINPEIVLLDLKFGSLDGLEILKDLLSKFPESIVIIMTAYGSIETSIKAIKLGAYDYIIKPIDLVRLKITIEKAVKYMKLKKKVTYLEKDLKTENNIIGNSKAMNNIFTIIEKIKDNNITVLIEGESGTGKELIARAIHDRGSRVEMNFEAINCGAIPTNLIESELFGYVKNAFTGANVNKKGRIELANGGTVFLDEIAETDMNFQVKLLRFLQEKEIYPLGSEKRKKVDVRVIAASNKNLLDEVKKGNFREDLYYRLNVVKIVAPRLDERKEDIPSLTDHFIRKANKNLNIRINGITDEALENLKRINYPGNVRELENMIYRACVLSDTEYIQQNDFLLKNSKTVTIDNDKEDKFIINIGCDLKNIERIAITETLKAFNGNKARTAKILGISDRNMRNKCKVFGL